MLTLRDGTRAPIVYSGEDADRIILKCRADGLRQSVSVKEQLLSRGLASLCTTRSSAIFVAIAVEMRWGALVELGRTESRVEEHQSHWWEEMELELPDGLAPRVYVRFAVYESSGRYATVNSSRLSNGGGVGDFVGGGFHQPRPKLVGMAGATLQELKDMRDTRGRGTPLTIHSPPASRDERPIPRGTLWVERADMVGFFDEAEELAKQRAKAKVAEEQQQEVVKSRRLPRESFELRPETWHPRDGR